MLEFGQEERAERIVGRPIPGMEYHRLPAACSIDWEVVFSEDSDLECIRWAQTNCPWCGRTCSPLLSPYLFVQDAGWRWVGLDHQEPYTEYGCRCPDCHVWYRFLIYVPQ